VKDDLIEILLLTKDRLNEIDVKSKYAYAYFIREQRFLLEVLEEIPNAKNIPGIYFSPFIETGYKNGYSSYRVVLIEETIKKTVAAIERVLVELMAPNVTSNKLNRMKVAEDLFF